MVDKQEQFALEYVKDFNGTRAAERAGYGGDDSSLAVTASRLLRKANIRHKVSSLIESNAMSSQEALWRLASMARVDISDFIKGTNEEFSLNWTNIRKYGFLIKSITQTKYGLKIELHDSQKALELIAKHLGLFTDRLDVTSSGRGLDDTYLAALRRIHEYYADI
jgi:phage terminase small subunit